MILSEIECQKAQEELKYLRAWAARLASDTSTARAGFTVVSVCAMISRISKEIDDYKATMATSVASENVAGEQADA